MLAAFAARLDAEDPLDNLEVAERPDPDPPEGWVTVEVRAAALNHHDLFALRGMALRPEQVPMILGTDAAGVDPDGNEVVLHAVIGDPDWRADETLDPKRTLLSELHQGTLAERVAVPRRNLVPKPQRLSYAEAASVPTAWLTAYRMLFTRGRCVPGETVLVQGAGGGLATAAIVLGAAAGLRVWTTSRDEDKRARALELGADGAFPSGERLPERVDCVIESVGQATWEHSIRSLRPGGRLVVSGATSGHKAQTDLRRVFFPQLDVIGSTMGTRDELANMLSFMAAADVRPVIDRTLPLSEAREGLAAMAAGDLFGKVVLEP
jgi:NADPH:quinone reductase-like Zn-dependent oxidoreductase